MIDKRILMKKNALFENREFSYYVVFTYRFPKPLQTFAAVVAILIMITGLAGNLLTIIALCKYPKVRNVAAAFIIRYTNIQNYILKVVIKS